MNKMMLAFKPEHYERFGVKPDIIEPCEDAMRTDGKEGSFEWWYVDSQFDNGNKAVFTFFTKSSEPDCDGPAMPSLKLVLTLPDGNTIVKKIHEPVNSVIRASKEKCDVTISNSYLKEVDGDYILHFEEEGIVIDLDMKSIVPMIRLGSGHTVYGADESKFFGWLNAQPTSKISGSLDVNGVHYDLVGNGYHDHNWGNVSIESLMNHWYWGRVSLGDYTVVTNDIVTHADYGHVRIPGLQLIKDDKVLVPNGLETKIIREDMFQHEFTKKFFHNKITFINTTDDITYTLVYNRERDIEAFFLYDSMGMPEEEREERRSRGLKPSYVRCTGTVTLTVEKDGNKEEYSEKGIWEQVHMGTNAQSPKDPLSNFLKKLLFMLKLKFGI